MTVLPNSNKVGRPQRAAAEQLTLSGPESSVPTDHAPHVWVRLPKVRTTPVFDSYWRFAAERQAIFFRRLEGEPPPWTSDPILLRHKFTNAYRASDRVSQFLIKHVIYTGDQEPSEVFFRTLLFKLFNRIETWERLKAAIGEVRWESYEFETYDRVLDEAISCGERIYSAAYIMPSGGRGAGDGRKHRMHLRLLERMMHDELPAQIGVCGRMQDAFDLLLSYPTIGDFLAYQYVTDLNYSTLTSFSEDEFVIPGPGARDGIHKCFSETSGLLKPDLIRLVADWQEEAFAQLEIDFRPLWGRRLQLIDCQNVFCEVGKYARVLHPEYTGQSGRTRIKQQFRANPEPMKLFYPPKWGINEHIPIHVRA